MILANPVIDFLSLAQQNSPQYIELYRNLILEEYIELLEAYADIRSIQNHSSTFTGKDTSDWTDADKAKWEDFKTEMTKFLPKKSLKQCYLDYLDALVDITFVTVGFLWLDNNESGIVEAQKYINNMPSDFPISSSVSSATNLISSNFIIQDGKFTFERSCAPDIIKHCYLSARNLDMNFDLAWEKVCAANLDKFRNGPDKDENGKQRKPNGWLPPDLSECLGISYGKLE